jgi:hypothetical protein
MARAVPKLALLLLLLALSGCEPLNSNELRQEVTGIHSNAAEGVLLAQGVAQDRTRSTFVRVQSKELSSASAASAEKLQDAEAPAELRRPLDRAIKLALDTSDALDELALKPGDEAEAAGTAKKLAELALRSRQLEDEL